MPSVNKTPNYGLNQWAGNEYAKRQDFVDDNELIDAALKANADASAPTSIRGTLLTGLSTATNAAITAADSILTALGKLQKQITDHKVTTQDSLDAKVDKVVGKQLSTEDYTTVEKNKLSDIETGATADQTASEIKTAYESNGNTNAYTDAERIKLAGIQAGAQVNAVTSVNSKTGAVSLAKSDVGLSAVLNYGIATTAEAQAGTSNAKYMTPLRTKDAIQTLGLLKFVTGSYTGNGAASRAINCGIAPKQVQFLDSSATTNTVYRLYTAWKFDTSTFVFIHSANNGSMNNTDLVLSSTGFTVSLSHNKSGYPYYWVAIA